LELAIAELRTLLEHFANNKLMDIVVDAVNALIDDTRRDQSLREWFKSIDVYIRKVSLPPTLLHICPYSLLKIGSSRA
jgi:Family of unknown function (DUF5923)